MANGWNENDGGAAAYDNSLELAAERGALLDQPDFYVDNQGTIVLLIPNSDAARQWVIDNLPSDALTFGGGTVIEHRYAEDILFGIHNDGLTFEVR